MSTLIIALIIAIMGVLMYRFFWKEMFGLKPKKETPPGQAKLYLFYTEWCGFSQKAMPEWESAASQLNGQTIGKYQVECIKVNCEDDKQMCSLYEIEAYPSVRLETADGLYELTKRVTSQNLIEFVDQTLG